MKRIIIPQSLIPALRDGRKTQHRVPLRPKDIVNRTRDVQIYDLPTIGEFRADKSGVMSAYLREFPGVSLGELRCPYKVGDELWVPETWCEASPEHRDRHGVRQAIYKASTSGDGDDIRQDYIRLGHAYRWRSPATMPRWASRFALTVAAVRVERVQDIGEADAVAEGMRSFTKDGRLWKYWPCDPCDGPIKNTWQDLPRNAKDAFVAHWDATHGPGAWTRNDPVWVPTFTVRQGGGR